MNPEIFDIIIPSIAFFIAFYAAFNLAELFIILILNRLIFKYWGFFAYKVMYLKIYYGRSIEIIAEIFLTIFILELIIFTSTIDILISATLGTKILAVLMLVEMIFVYWLTTLKFQQFHFTKKIYLYFYIYTSLIIFVLVVTLSHIYYDGYQKYINASIVLPVKAEGILILENNKRRNLLALFREEILKNGCPRINFLNIPNGDSIPSFVYVATHSDLKIINKPINTGDISSYLSGRLCVNDEAKFLLTDYGQWYWVIEQRKNKS